MTPINLSRLEFFFYGTLFYVGGTPVFRDTICVTLRASLPAPVLGVWICVYTHASCVRMIGFSACGCHFSDSLTRRCIMKSDKYYSNTSAEWSVGQCLFSNNLTWRYNEVNNCYTSCPVPNKPTVSVDVKQHFNNCYVRSLRCHLTERPRVGACSSNPAIDRK